MSGRWNKNKRAFEEGVNREGHWTREFTSRTEPWPVVEQWANDCDFHLIAMRGRRRLYQKGTNPSFYTTLIDIKQREEGRGMVISAWINVGFTARLLSLFFHPREMAIEPSGFRGAFKRREACRDFNQLLTRFNQTLIVGSRGLHPADLDPSSVILAALLFAPIAIYLFFGGAQVEIGRGLSNGLIAALFQRLNPLFMTAGVLLIAHYMIVAKKLGTWLAKSISIGLCTLGFTVLSIVLLTQSTSDITIQKISYHCVYRYDEAACRATLNEIPPKERAQIAGHVQKLANQLGVAVGPVNEAPKTFY